ncbi:MAG: hypothetical protein H6529_15360 [Nocardioides sp.]|nr:hypothetical protein [Nocardioidaceae bacterium]MCB8957843.1 hypothetical protein [Nocardioides sp.]
MSTTQWVLNLALLAWVLGRNVGTKALTPAFFAVPALLVATVAVLYLRHIPTAGDDDVLVLVGAGTGAVLGVVAAGLTRVHRRADTLAVTAGIAFAALWIAVIAGRVAFAEWASHSGAMTIGRFSMRHHITGADAWTAAFVLMALAMVVTRYATTAAAVTVWHHRAVPAAEVVR